MCYYMRDIEQPEPSKVFKVEYLENMYSELLKCQGIDLQSQVLRFEELLFDRNADLEKRTVMYFQNAADAFFNDAISEPSSF